MVEKAENYIPIFSKLAVDEVLNGLCLANSYLPEEVVINILSFIDPKDLLNYCFVCRQWNNIIKSYALWSTIYRRKYNKNPKVLPWYLFYCLFSTNLFDTNLLQNGNGQNNFENWNTFSKEPHWLIEDIPKGCDPLPNDTPEFNNETSCFAVSKDWGVKEQHTKFGRNKLFRHILSYYKPHIYLSEWVASRFNCESIYKIKCGLKGLDWFKRGMFEPAVEYRFNQSEGKQWTKIELLLVEYPSELQDIVFEHKGNYGSKMAGGVVKILFDSIQVLYTDEHGCKRPKQFTEVKFATNGIRLEHHVLFDKLPKRHICRMMGHVE